MHKVLKWFSLAVMLGVISFITYFLYFINAVDDFTEIQPMQKSKTVAKEKLNESWLNNFSEIQKKGYFYPVNEIYVKIDLDEKITKTIIYKLSAPILDPYQIFCLKAELKNHNLKYLLKKQKNSVELLIFSKNKKKLDSLVRVLKKYQISAIIKPYKEEV